MKLQKQAGVTSEIWQVFIQDSSSTIGAGLTGLLFNTASLTAYYHRDVDTTATAITLVTMTVGTFTSGGFKEIDATNMPGWYQFCPPNAALTGAKSCGFHLKGATNMAPLPIEVQLTAVNVDDSVRFGLSALPNVSAGSTNGLLINGTNTGTVVLAALTCTGSFTISDGLLLSRSGGNNPALSVTGNGTGSGAVFTSGSGATGDGIQVTSNSANGNGLVLTKTGTGLALKGATTDLTLAKTTNITGFNDIAATSIVSSGAITTSGGAVSTVTTTTTATNLTNAPTAGDLTATMKTSVTNAVWDATMSAHVTALTTGAALNAAGAAGDPWTTAIPGAYGAGTAGHRLGNIPDVTAGASGGLFLAGTNAATTVASLTCTGSLTVSDGLLISRSTSNTSAITATGNGTGSGAVFTSGSGATGDGVQITANSTNGNGMVATKTGSGLAHKGATTDLVLAKTTNITGFNDIAATAVVSSGAITTSGGAVSTVSAVTGLTASNLDATISSRMATYTQPSGFLAATFPTGTIANTTNITAGTITTVSAVTGLTASNLDATISSRMATYTQPTGFLAATFPATVASTTNITTATGIDVTKIAGNTNAATNLSRATLTNGICTVGVGSTTTSIVTSSMDPAAATADQFKGRILTFSRTTTTTNLRGQATDITANTSGGVLTVTPLTDPPVTTDEFTIT